MAIGFIFPRLGDLQHTLGLDERTLSLALIGTATGTLLSLMFASRWLLLAGFEPASQRPDSHADVAPHWARPTRTTFMLVAATLAAIVLEGAGTEWLAIYMRDVFGAPPFIAGLAVALGAGAQALARW